MQAHRSALSTGARHALGVLQVLAQSVAQALIGKREAPPPAKRMAGPGRTAGQATEESKLVEFTAPLTPAGKNPPLTTSFAGFR